MTTTQQQRPTVVTVQSSRRTALIVGMAVIGLLIGLLGGWLLFSTDDVIEADGSALTDRQAEMVAMIADNFAAWEANDVDTALSYYTDTARFVALGEEFPVADGTLAEYITSFFGAPNMEKFGPDVVVDGNTVVAFHTFRGVAYTNLFNFTSTGDVLIVRHEVVR